MNEIATQVALGAGIVVTFLFGPGVAFAFMFLKKRRRRAQRRSPINIDLLRGPGHTVREQLEEASTDLTFDLLTISVIPLLTLALYLAQRVLLGEKALSYTGAIYAVLGVGSVLWLAWKMAKTGDKLDRLRAGFDAELAVGQELDRLMREGAWVYHDVPGDNFNIDHVVVSTKGVFAVETKGYTKPTHLTADESIVEYDGKVLRFPMWTVTKPLEQAERQADWLARSIGSAAGVSLVVVPVLALPGWYVRLTGRGPVRVYNARQLSSLLQSVGSPGTELEFAL